MKKHLGTLMIAMFCLLLCGATACGGNQSGTGDSTLSGSEDSVSDSESSSDSEEPLPDKNPNVKITHSAFGAKGDGSTNNREAIQKAIDYVEKCGGGTVTIPSGQKSFVSGNLFLKDNVELHFEEGAILKQSAVQTDYAMFNDGEYEAYLPKKGHDSSSVTWGHAWYENYPFIYAGEGTQNVKVTGKGIIEMTRGDGRVHGDDYEEKPEICDEAIHVCPIGFYRVDGFEISDITIRNYFTYAIMPYTCNNGLIKGITIKEYNDKLNTDGISLMNCQNIRITECDLTTGDDALYVFTSYGDPRGGTWWNSENLQPSRNIEIDHNTTWSGCKGFGLILWGNHCEDLSKVEVSNLYVHDNTFSSMGIWNEDYFNDIPGPTPVKNVRFENNQITPGIIEDSFYTTPISNMQGNDGFPSMPDLQNGDFEKTGEAYWCLSGGAEVLREDDNYYGKLTYSAETPSELFQGINLKAGREYAFTANVYTSGASARLFIRNADTNNVVAYKEFSDTTSSAVTLNYIPSETANYQIGVMKSEANEEGWCIIDDASLTYDKTEQTIFTTQTADQGFGAGGHFVLGTRFYATEDGLITKVRIYTAAGEDGIHQVSIWDADGVQVVAGPYDWNIVAGTEGWQSFTLPEVCHISANKSYIVSVSNTESDQYYAQSAVANMATTNGSLVVESGSGYFNYYGEGHNMPYMKSQVNYLRDVVFLPAEQTIFTEEIPDDFTDDARYELGTKFRTKVSGSITKVRIYTAEDESGVHTVRLWDVSANRLIAGPFEWDIEYGYEGWRTFELPKAVHISANRDYIISVSNSEEDWLYPRATGIFSFANVTGNRDLIVFEDSGTYSASLGFMPTSISPVFPCVNYLRDIVFVADKDPVTEEVDKYALEDLYAVYNHLTQEAFKPDDWEKFQTALTNAKNVLENPSATQERVDEAYAELSEAVELTIEQSIFAEAIPDDFTNDAHYELGTKFRTKVPGVITKVRIYTVYNEDGVHTVSLWDVSENRLIAGPFDWEIEKGFEGWREFKLPESVQISVNRDYIVSVSNSEDNYIYPRATGKFSFKNLTGNRDLIVFENSGMYSVAIGCMPASLSPVSPGVNYLRDVVFIADDTSVAVTELILDQTAVTLNEVETLQLNVSMLPEDALERVTWSSSDESVATVSLTGFVRAVSAGKAIITVTSESGKTATCEITVVATQKGQSIFTTQTADQAFSNGGHFVLGTKFHTTKNGTIIGVRIYTAAGENGIHQVSIWDADGVQVVAGPYDWNIVAGTEGWQSFILPEACHIVANKNYIVSVSNTAGDQLFAQSAAANQAITNGDLVVESESGYYNYYGEGSNMPFIQAQVNYLRDVIFVADNETEENTES